jgi:hypothetical protein
MREMALYVIQLLDLQILDVPARSRVLSVLVELSKESSQYPECLILRDVEKKSGYPVDQGGCGDIWRGEIGGHDVAIKVMRVWTAKTSSKVLSTLL